MNVKQPNNGVGRKGPKRSASFCREWRSGSTREVFMVEAVFESHEKDKMEGPCSEIYELGSGVHLCLRQNFLEVAGSKPRQGRDTCLSMMHTHLSVPGSLLAYCLSVWP